MLQVRIYVGDGRESFECLHQKIGQQFDIDAGKACDKVFVSQMRWMSRTLNANFNRDTFRANHHLCLNTLRFNYSQTNSRLSLVIPICVTVIYLHVLNGLV